MRLINKLVRKICITLIQLQAWLLGNNLHQPTPPLLCTPTHIPCGIIGLLNNLSKIYTCAQFQGWLILSSIGFGKHLLEVWCSMNGLSRPQTDWMLTNVNKPLISELLLPLLQNESWCTFFHTENTFSWMFIVLQIKVVHQDPFWNRGKKQLGNGVLCCSREYSLYFDGTVFWFSPPSFPQPNLRPSENYVFICFIPSL